MLRQLCNARSPQWTTKQFDEMAEVESQQRELQRGSHRFIHVPHCVPIANLVIVIEHPNLHLGPEERRLFGQLFSAADTEKIGVITGEVAVKFFEKTRLSPDILGEVDNVGVK